MQACLVRTRAARTEQTTTATATAEVTGRTEGEAAAGEDNRWSDGGEDSQLPDLLPRLRPIAQLPRRAQGYHLTLDDSSPSGYAGVTWRGDLQRPTFEARLPSRDGRGRIGMYRTAVEAAVAIAKATEEVQRAAKALTQLPRRAQGYDLVVDDSMPYGYAGVTRRADPYGPEFEAHAGRRRVGMYHTAIEAAVAIAKAHIDEEQRAAWARVIRAPGPTELHEALRAIDDAPGTWNGWRHELHGRMRIQRARLGDELAARLDSIDGDIGALRSAMDMALAAGTQVHGLSPAFEAALRHGHHVLAEADAETRRRAERRAAGAPEDLPEMPRELRCPITMEPLRDPVIAADGHAYERSALARHLQTSHRSPMTNEDLPHTEVVPSITLRTLAGGWPEREHALMMRWEAERGWVTNRMVPSEVGLEFVLGHHSPRIIHCLRRLARDAFHFGASGRVDPRPRHCVACVIHWRIVRGPRAHWRRSGEAGYVRDSGHSVDEVSDCCEVCDCRPVAQGRTALHQAEE